MNIQDLVKLLRSNGSFEEFRETVVEEHDAVSADDQAPNAMKSASSNDAAEWAPIIPDTVYGSGAGNTGMDDLLSASKGQVVIRVRNASDLSLETLGQITRLSDAQVAQFPGLLNRFDPEMAMTEDRVFAFAMRDDELVAAVHATRICKADDRVLHIANLNSDKTERGIATPLIAALVLGDTLWSGSPAGAESVARILPNGDANIGSTKTMMRLGLYTSGFFTHAVTTRNPQKTVPGSKEVDGSDLKYLMLRGDAPDVAERSQAALVGWSLKLGKTKTL